MKQFIWRLILAIIFPSFVFASAQIQVYPTFNLEHGGTTFAKDIYTKIVTPDFTDQQLGVPTYEIPTAGAYEVQFFPPKGYKYKTNKDCTGTIEDKELKVCKVFYSDGAKSTPETPVIIPTQTTPTPAPTATQTQPTEQPIQINNQDELIASLKAEIASLLQQIIALLTEKLNNLQQ